MQQPHRVVSQDEFIKAHTAHLADEKEFSKARDRLTAARRELPWVKVEQNYVFDGPRGPVTLSDLFEGRSQLIIKHFMLGPDWEQGCVGCSFESDHIDGARQHFEQHDVSFAAVARAPYPKIAAYQKRMGWTFNWVSSARNNFNFDFHVSFTPEQVAGKQAFYNYKKQDVGIDELSGISVFFKDDNGGIFHTFSAFGRGAEEILGAYMFIDMTPKGRNETGPNHNLTDWVKRHDEYDSAKDAACCGASHS